MKAAVTRLVDRFRDDPHSIDLLAATILQASQESVTASHPPEAVQSILVQVVHTTQPFRPFPQMFRNLEGLCAPDGRKLLDEIIDLQPGGQQIRDLLGDKVLTQLRIVTDSPRFRSLREDCPCTPALSSHRRSLHMVAKVNALARMALMTLLHPLQTLFMRRLTSDGLLAQSWRRCSNHTSPHSRR